MKKKNNIKAESNQSEEYETTHTPIIDSNVVDKHNPIEESQQKEYEEEEDDEAITNNPVHAETPPMQERNQKNYDM